MREEGAYRAAPVRQPTTTFRHDVAELDDQTKLRIVLALAQFETPTDISKELLSEGIEADKRQVGAYDPTRPYYSAGERWREIFTAERKRYMEEVSAVPIANQGFRLNMLQKNLEKAMASGNRVLANQTLRQAAEEVGGALTNERNVKMTRPLEEVSADERRAMFAEVIRKALEAKDPPGTAPAPSGVQ